jgi:hypothetical protein
MRVGGSCLTSRSRHMPNILAQAGPSKSRLWTSRRGVGNLTDLGLDRNEARNRSVSSPIGVGSTRPFGTQTRRKPQVQEAV